MKFCTWAGTLVLAVLFVAMGNQALAQGCVAIRHFSVAGNRSDNTSQLQPGQWEVGANYRYFESFRHFRGTHEEPDRVSNNTEVINYSHSLDLSALYSLTNQWYVNAIIPIVHNDRSSLYEHGREERHLSSAFGLADMRIGAGYWFFTGETALTSNVALSAGIKIPTGDANAMDEFQNVGPNGGPEERPVDQSIQPGDGGWGITLAFQGYQHIFDNLYGYASGFYLLNPREMNETRTYRETLCPILLKEALMSVPEQSSVGGGVNYMIHDLGLALSVGARYEGVPVEDLIGGSEGFRRPGSVFSIEPGVSYTTGDLSLNFQIPTALMRNRPQSVTDLETSMTVPGQEGRNGDAAFADYLINFGFTYRFGGDSAPAIDTKMDPMNMVE